MELNMGYVKKKIATGNMTYKQLIQVGPKLVHQGLARWKKNTQNQAMNNYKGKRTKSVAGELKSETKNF